MSMAVSVVFFLLIWAAVVILYAKKYKTESRALNIKWAIYFLFLSILTYVFIATGSIKDGFLYAFWFCITVLLCACGIHLKNAFSKRNVLSEQPNPQKDCDRDDTCPNKNGARPVPPPNLRFTLGSTKMEECPVEGDLDDNDPPKDGSGILKEGATRKGGLNGDPTTPRPEPPKPQRLAGNHIKGS